MSSPSSKDDCENAPRALENQPPEARKSTSGGSKMVPKWLQNGSPKASRSRSRLLRPFWSAPGRPGAAPGAFLGRSWRALGLPRCPRRLPEGPREGPGEPPGRHFGSIFAARPAGTKKVRKSIFFKLFFDVVFMLFFAFFLRLPRCGGASAHLDTS